MGELGLVVSRRRRQRGWSLQELASKTSATKTAIWKLESGATDSPSVALITEIAMAFDTTVDPLLVEAGLLPKPPESIVWTPELIQIQQMLNTLNVSREYELLHEALQLVLAIGEQAAAESDDGGETCNDLVNSSL